jgi:hypothetical protein
MKRRKISNSLHKSALRRQNICTLLIFLAVLMAFADIALSWGLGKNSEIVKVSVLITLGFFGMYLVYFPYSVIKTYLQMRKK